MFLSELSRYKTILGSVSGTSLSPDRLSWLLDKVGVKVDPIGVSLITEFISANVGKKKLSSLLENEKLMGELDQLIAKAVNKDNSKEEVSDLISARSVIRCPHCNLPFSIIDAPGVRDKIKN